MVTNKFAVFILTHGRPDRVITYDTLRNQGYTGDIYLIVDNEDETVEQYRAKFGDKVIVFDKQAVAQTFDEMGVFKDRRAVVYARNASFEIAKKLGLDYFLQLDDDYKIFYYKYSGDGYYLNNDPKIKSLDRLFATMLEYFKGIPALSLAMMQSGDFVAGDLSQYATKIATKRKAMNTFFCAVDRPFSFTGRINEDVNTYVLEGNRGGLFLSINQAAIHQKETQQNEGGMTGLYLDSGTYVKSFYTVMLCPSAVKVGSIGHVYPRLHHAMRWENITPKILSETHRRTG